MSHHDQHQEMNLATFEACVKSMFFGDQSFQQHQSHHSAFLNNNNNHTTSSSSSSHQLPSPNVRIPRDVAVKKLRTFCVEDNFCKLVDLLSDADLVWKSEYSTTILTKTLRFIVASKVNLSVELRNRVFDEFESFGGNDDFYEYLSKSNDDHHHHYHILASSNGNIHNSNSVVVQTDQKVIDDIVSLLFDVIFCSVSPKNSNNNQPPEFLYQDLSQRNLVTSLIKTAKVNLNQIASFAAFLFFCLYKDMTILSASQYRVPHNKFSTDFPSVLPSAVDHTTSRQQTEPLFGTSSDARQNLLFRMIDELNSILFQTRADLRDGTELSTKMNKFWFRTLLKEIIIEFSDQPATSPWDTFASRSHFLFPLLVFCERAVRHDFDAYFTVVSRQMAIARDHQNNNNNNGFDAFFPMDLDDMADAEEMVAKSCGNFSEFCNFIVKRTMFLLEVLGEESMRLPSFEWKCAFGSIMLFLRGITQAMFSQANRNPNTARYAPGTVALSHLHPRVCESVFSLLGVLSTISHDTFIYCTDQSHQQQQSRNNTSINNNIDRMNNSFNPYTTFINHAGQLQNAPDEYFNSIVAGVCIESNDEEGSDFGYNDYATFSMNESFSPNFHYSTQRQHVVMLVQIATILMEYAKECNASSFGRNNNSNNNNSSILPPYFSLRIGSDAFETCGRVLSNLAERFPETLTELMASSQLHHIPSPDALDELAQFSVGAGKYSMMFCENSLRYFLTFSNCVIFQIGNFMKQSRQQSSSSSSTFNPSDTERQNLDAIKSKLENLIVNSVSTLYEFIFSDTFQNFSNNNNNGGDGDFQVPPESESEMMLSLVGSMLVRKTGDSFFLIRHLTGMFEQAVGCFFSVSNSSSPQAWNFDNPQVRKNVYLVPFIIQTVAQSLQSCQDSGLQLSQSTYTNSETILKELEEVYEEKRNNNSDENNDKSRRRHHHPFIHLLFLVCQFSEEIAAVAMKSLQDLLENLSINDDENNNNMRDVDDDLLFIDLIPSQFTPIFRALFYLFRTATRAGVMLRGPFSNAMVELCGFVLRSSASSALSLRNKLLYEDAINLLSLLWGSGNEALQMTSHLQVSENLYSFHLEDRLYLTSSAAFFSSTAATTMMMMMMNDLLNHASNFPTSPSYNKNSFFALRRKTLSLFYQRANIFAFEGNKIDCARIINQMTFFTNVHSWGRDDHHHDELQLEHGNNDDNSEKLIRVSNLYRCWLKDIKAAFCVGREVLHRRIFMNVLQKAILGFFEEEMSDEEDERSGNTATSSFWGSVFSSHDKDRVPSLRKLCNMSQFFGRNVVDDDDDASGNLKASARGLISDLTELCRQITQVAVITLGSVPPSSQTPFFYEFVSCFIITAARLIQSCSGNFRHHQQQYQEEELFSDNSNNKKHDGFTEFAATPHLVINLAHTLWNLLSAKWINLGVLFMYNNNSSHHQQVHDSFRSLMLFVAKYGLAKDMKSMMTAKDALVVSNISVLSCSSSSSFTSISNVLELLLNPRAALEDALLVIADDDEGVDDGTTDGDSSKKKKKKNNNNPLIELFDTGNVNNHDRQKQHQQQPPAVLIGKYGAGVTNYSNNERFFSLTRFYMAARNHHQYENNNNNNSHLSNNIQNVMAAVNACLDCIAKQPDRTFYIRNLHCLLGTLDDVALRIVIGYPSSSSSSFAATSISMEQQNLLEVRTIFAGILEESLIVNRNNFVHRNEEEKINNNIIRVSILDDILLTIVPLLLSNQLSHLEDVATSAIAIIARLYDLCNNNSNNNGDERWSMRFRFCMQILRDKCLCLDVHKQRITFIMTALETASDFGDAVKKLSREIVQLQPSLLSIFASSDEQNIRARMSKKNVIPMVPF